MIQDHALDELEWMSRNFGEWLDGLMTIRRLSARQVATRAGISHTGISRLRRGLTQPTFATAVALMRALR